MTTGDLRKGTGGRPQPAAATNGQERHGLLREWIESLGPAAVVTLLSHDDYEREQLQLQALPASPPALATPGR
jgi:hypothetical protein